jgi:hypothetical protein
MLIHFRAASQRRCHLQLRPREARYPPLPGDERGSSPPAASADGQGLDQARPSKDLDASSGQITHHYLQEGQEALDAAFYWRAGLHARSLYANSEAPSYFEAALAPGDRHRQAAFSSLHRLLTRYPTRDDFKTPGR